MSDGEYRLQKIPKPQDLSPELVDRFEVFLGSEYLGRKLDEGIAEIVQNPGLSEELNVYLKDQLPKEYKFKRELVIEFFKTELFSVLSELKLLENPDEISISFEKRDGGGAGITTEENMTFLSLDIMKTVLLILQFDQSEEKRANFIHDISHEFFHKYVSDHYKRADENTKSANSKNIGNEPSEEYQRDRGEIASELYAAHHLEQRAKREAGVNQKFSDALSERAKKIRNDGKLRTSDKQEVKTA